MAAGGGVLDGAAVPRILSWMSRDASPTCTACGQIAPPTTTTYTVIGAGWRLARSKNAQGGTVVAWLCPACWKAQKQKMR